MADSFDNLIAGEWVRGSDYSENRNPSNVDDLIGLYAEGTVDDVNTAVNSAVAAAPHWKRFGVQARCDLLDAIGSELLRRKEELGDLLAREEGKTLPEAIGEVVRAGHIFKFFAAQCIASHGEVHSSLRASASVEVTREPLGVVGIITPWNFPIAIPAWKVAPALAYGNCVVLKPAENTSASAWALAEVIQRVGVPPGVFNLVMGRGDTVGKAITEHPDVAGISFTGSTRVGLSIAQSSSTALKRKQVEMGGKNPQVVLDDADLDLAVDISLQSAFYSSGQRCTAASRLIVTEGIYSRFVRELTARVSALRVGDARAAGTDIGPVVSRAQLQSHMRYVDKALSAGARLVAGGTTVSCHTGSGNKGYFMAPTLFAETDNAMVLNQEEVFGPVACIIKAADYDEALFIANDSPYGLSAGIATSSLKYAARFKNDVQAGMVMVNLPTAGVDYHVPFGGRKASSVGPREQGLYARDFYTVIKTSYTAAG
ncbi:aldehyde dehydrogenase family protein [Cupriavidus pinatubonensis]|uniref:Aldehyde dehydrogenase, thermostable n=1 Tax=Cupriavidus pinatubonensis TaxID=248026 RepID=A0ABM8XXB9_9BURK|nr:aldehyde dehydrogenase family protein [Cupriavidus pinatubonensis]CAG9185009.1 Aldehyde dehydrogenase, thermostable [Cupriavidus pinatubonensis]